MFKLALHEDARNFLFENRLIPNIAFPNSKEGFETPNHFSQSLFHEYPCRGVRCGRTEFQVFYEQ